MDVEPIASSSVTPDPSGLSAIAMASKPEAFGSSGTPKKPSRVLRARPSDPPPPPLASPSPATSSTLIRPATRKELENISRRLSKESIDQRRDELIKEREGELRTVMDEHDTAVREKFHLERFVTMITGFHPKVVKEDNSPVFLEYKRANHNLLDLAPSAAMPAAGPSRPRSSVTSRTTRRQANEQSGILSFAAKSPPKADVTHTNGNEGEVEEAKFAAPGKGKGKARVSDVTVVLESTPAIPIKGKRSSTLNDMPPPPVPKGRRKTLGTPLPDPEPEVEAMNSPDDPGGKGKKRGRASLPNLQSKKLRAAISDDASASPSPAVDTPAEVVVDPPEPSPLPELPSLAHLPFPPPPNRPYERPKGPRRIWYTHPSQLPPSNAKFHGDISAMLSSYIHVEDTGPPADLKALEIRALNEAYIRNRVNYLQNQGRLTRLLDEDDEVALKSKAHQKQAALPSRKTDHHDHLLSHMVQVRTAMLSEAKSKPVVCKRIARMVAAYWEHEQGKEERERQAEERERKRKGRDVVRALKKRWSLAVKIVRARILEAQKAEQDRLGKEHLQNMLQRSTGLLDAQREEIVGREDDASDSEGTEEVSAAEDTEDLEEADDPDALPNGVEDDEGAEHDGDVEVEAENEDGEDTEDEDGDEEADDESQDTSDDESDSETVDLRALFLDDGEVSTAQEALSSTMEASAEAADRTLPPASSIADMNELEDAGQSADTAITDLAIHVDGAQEDGAPSSPNPLALPSDLPDPLLPSSPPIQPVDLPPSPTPKSSPAPVRSRRARKSRSVTTLSQGEDPDANDAEFAEVATSDVDIQDQELDVEMEEADEKSEADSEDAGLLADADVPIEELLKRYGYSSEQMSVIPDGAPEQEDVAFVSGESKEIDVKPNGHTDTSLLDENLKDRSTSPAMVVEGKRQRRVRSVWTPEDNPPLKKPKIEEIESEIEMTPELSDEDEDDTGDDEDSELESVNEDGGPKIRPPFLLRGTLRPYQQAGLEWLASLYANNMNGILADEMGLGKTIQTIALLGHLACDRGVWGQHLIIVPTSVILNWEMEFKKFLPGLKTLTYYGNQKERKEKRIGWHTDHTWQVCITSYQIVLADQHIFRRKNWVYMILDEAHNIKNFRSQRWQTLLGFKAQRRLLLTGTPLQNNLMELWSLLYFLMPGGVAETATAVVGFANHKEFTEWFSNPMDKAIEHGDVLDEETLATVAKLHTLLRPFILRRLKSEVETQLPGKFEHVVYCRLSKRQRFLYDEFMSRSSTHDALTTGGYLGVMNTLMQLRKVCNHPDLFEVRPVRTSFAMDRGVAADFSPTELLVRRRLLEEQDVLELEALNLKITDHEAMSGWTARSTASLDASDLLPHAVVIPKKGKQPAPPKPDTRTVEGWLKYQAYVAQQASVTKWRSLRDINRLRCSTKPIWGSTFLEMLSELPNRLLPLTAAMNKRDLLGEFTPPASELVLSFSQRAESMAPVIEKFAVIPPNAVARDLPTFALPGLAPNSHEALLDPDFDTLHHPTVKLQIAFPDASLLQYDCGKLQKLYEMLRDLKSNGHRVLIFTQMTRVLDILEMFLSYNGHRYLRLDGSTKIEDRQIITERFNSDSRIFCFIASSRSGGVGINLTGADTVFFYDSDWNPSMDRQCMDRAHRIGQTREVHIYRFVSSHTVEENMLKKANQKRLLDRVIIQEGDFTTDFFGKMDWRDLIDAPPAVQEEEDRVEDVPVEGTPEAEDVEVPKPRTGEERELARALAEVEDEEDAAAAKIAQGENELDVNEFDEHRVAKAEKRVRVVESGTETPMEVEGQLAEDGPPAEEEEEDDDVGAVDEYMLKWVEEDWDWFVSYQK
ncbi:SNF2 family N-terminal domain-domain-containing protein [Naematelia encephala]|uniref:Helicase SWR1 n=1 Tax=Naematelia encephala TaxID=71784 RepID=A0A1Y2AVC0_9TREE|nr:SNF2 family N-terminal domain-domain-containing protein [Naematelia encephala]